VTAGVADSPAIVVDAEDQFGNIVTTDPSNVTLAVASGPSSASGTLTVAASSGVATFSNVTFDRTGSYTLTASDASLTTATSSSFIVSAASLHSSSTACSLAMSLPASPTARPSSPMSRTSSAHCHEQYFQCDFGSGQRPGGASGTLTVAASSGVATFSNVILDTAVAIPSRPVTAA